jgi:hypothetical protein
VEQIGLEAIELLGPILIFIPKPWQVDPMQVESGNNKNTVIIV